MNYAAKQYLVRAMCIIAVSLLLIPNPAVGQKHSLGLSLGVSNFLGDLGGSNGIGTIFLKDLEGKAFRPSLSVDYRFTYNPHFNIRSSLTLTQVVGDDAWLNVTEPGNPAFARRYRNLHFKSVILELSGQIEWNLLRYAPGDRDNWWTPYFAAGVGLFFFNPKAEFEGQWYKLQPLGTEGQGLPGYGNRYIRVTPSFPVSFGIKFNLSRRFTLGFDITHRFTLTDYIDDVSGVYADPVDFYAVYEDQRAALLTGLSRRSNEFDPDETYGYITGPGQQRGDPKNKDQFFTSSIFVSYNFGKNTYSCPPKKQF